MNGSVSQHVEMLALSYKGFYLAGSSRLCDVTLDGLDEGSERISAF